MNSQFLIRQSCALLILLPLVANAAQEQNNVDQAEAAVPAVVYSSAFADYIPFRPAELMPWREANESVSRTGGHGGHMAPAAAAASPIQKNPASAVPTSAPHAGHHMGATP
jgi:hypothetical protein